MTIIKLMGDVPSNYGLSPEDATSFKMMCAAVIVGDGTRVASFVAELTASEDPNAAIAIKAFDAIIRGNTPPARVPYRAPAADEVARANIEATSLLRRIGMRV